MNDKLYISGSQVDLIKGQPISITYSQADISDPSKRKRSYSKTFKLAGTASNEKFFKEYLMLTWVRNDNIVTDVSFNPSLNLPCKLYKDEYLRFEGFIKLLDVEIDKGVVTFIVNMYSEVSNLFQQWDDLMLEELGWSEYNHLLNESNIKSSWSNSVKLNGVSTSNFSGVNPKGWGYIYGVVDYGLSPNQTDYTDNQLFPLFYYREIFIKAFAYIGITIDSNFIDSQEFKDLLFGWGGGDNPTLEDALINGLYLDVDFNASFTNTNNATVVPDPIYGGTLVNSVSNYKTLNLLTNEATFTEVVVSDSLNQVANGVVTVGATAVYSVNIVFDAIMSNVSSSDATINSTKLVADVILVNGTKRINLGHYSYAGSAPPVWSVNKTIELSLSTNDDYYIYIQINGTSWMTGSGTFGTLTTGMDLNNTFKLTSNCISSEVVTNSEVYLANYIPKMKVVDFVKAALTHFNLYISDPTVENVVKIEPMPNYYESNNDNDNWTNKQDFSKKIKITPIATKQPSQLDYVFKHDKDFYSEDYYNSRGKYYGDYHKDNSLSYGGGSQQYSLPYCLTPLVGLPNGLVIPRIVKIDNGVVKPFKGSPRMYVYGGMKAGSFNILDNGGTPIPESQYPVLSNLDDIDNPTLDICFGTPELVYYATTSYTTNTAFKRFYSLLVNELNSEDSKMLTSYFRLNQNDIQQGFMRRVKLIDSVLYRFNLLKDYNVNADGSYLVELVKILEVKAVSSNVIPLTPLTSSIDVTNGQQVLETSKSQVVQGFQKMIIVNSESKEDVSLDIATIPIGKETLIYNKSNKSVKISSLGAETINGKTSHVLNTVNSFVKLVYTGSEYLIIAE